MKLASIGEAMIELSLQGDAATLGVAGDTLNTAVYLARLSDIDVSFVTKLGRDPFSDRIADFIAAEGVGTGLIARHPTRTAGLYAISLDAQGERSFSYWRGESAARELFSDRSEMEALRDFDVLYFSGITLAILSPPARTRLIGFLTSYRAGGGQLVFDGNYRPALWEDAEAAKQWTARVWESCDIALPSVDDEMALFGDADMGAVLARFGDYGVKEGALKCGASGPVSLGENCDETAYAAAGVVDSTAAGDSFNAGYLAAKLRGAPQAEALRAGHDCACRVISAKGAIIPKDQW